MCRVCALLALLLTLPAAVSAEPASRPAPDSAETELNRGIEAVSNARFREALEILHRAERQAETRRLRGRVQLYLGITHAVLGDAGKARGHFRAALVENPELSLDPTRIKADVVRMLEEVRAGTLGELEVTATLAGATVYVDGKLVGRTPLTSKLPVGPHDVEVRDAGGRPRFSQRLVIDHSQPTRVEVEADLVDRPEKPRRPAPPPEPRRRVWTWVATGMAAAAAVAGAGLWISASIDHEEFVDSDTEAARGEELREIITTKQTALYTLFGASGALAVTAAVLYVVEGRSPRRREARLAPMAGPGRVGLVLTWRH